MNKKRFSPTDQSTFAKLSGDYNPIHIDEVAARRLLFGAPVVHGVQQFTIEPAKKVDCEMCSG